MTFNFRTMTGPALSFGLAILIFGLALVGHLPLWVALALAGVMAIYGVVLLVGWRHSETIRLMAQDAGSKRDEREQLIHLRAASFSYVVVVLLAISMFLAQLARGDTSTSPWMTVGAVAGLSYAVSLFVLQRQTLNGVRPPFVMHR